MVGVSGRVYGFKRGGRPDMYGQRCVRKRGTKARFLRRGGGIPLFSKHYFRSGVPFEKAPVYVYVCVCVCESAQCRCHPRLDYSLIEFQQMGKTYGVSRKGECSVCTPYFVKLRDT